MDPKSARFPHAVFPAGVRATRSLDVWGQRVHPALPAQLLLYAGGEDTSWPTRMVRSALAQALASRFRVTVVGDFADTPASELPAPVKVVCLPPLGSLASDRERRRILVSTYAAVRPRVVVVEQFPFGELHLGAEIVHLLKAATATPRAPFVVSSVRQPLDHWTVSTADAKASRSLAEGYLDAVLVHADPNISRIENAFVDDAEWSVPIRYTGFISVDPRGPADVPHERLAEGGEIVVFGEGGGPGDRLCHVAVDACKYLSAADRLPMRVIAGPAMPPDEFQALQDAAAGTAGVIVERDVADVWQLLAGAAVTVAHTAYPLLDLVRSRVPALVVPPVSGSQEQTARTQRLAAQGALRVVEPEWLDGQTLACQIASTIGFTPRRAELDLSGAGATVRFLTGLLDAASLLNTGTAGVESMGFNRNVRSQNHRFHM
jgi:predicted glycosyltransferase